MTGTVPLAVSYKAGDRLLGARHGTVARLVAAGRLRPVRWGNRARVLRVDLERVATEGFTPEATRPRTARPRPTKPGIAAAILAIETSPSRGTP